MSIRVMIVDDHAVVAEGLRFVVDAQADMEVVACVEDSRQAVDVALRQAPDIVLMDHAMPELNGAEATHLIRSRCPGTRVIILSMYSNQVHVMRGLQAGAMGYVVKKSAAKEVVEAIRAVHRGGRYLSKELLDMVVGQVSHGIDNPLMRLSSRERQVLQLLAEGSSTNQIAERLSLSHKTVETYRARLMEKLDIHDFATLIKFAIQHGVTSLE
jgi:DNA-binding NarL/FixJ family response regulator